MEQAALQNKKQSRKKSAIAANLKKFQGCSTGLYDCGRLATANQ
jgi:hypothetical protein